MDAFTTRLIRTANAIANTPEGETAPELLDDLERFWRVSGILTRTREPFNGSGKADQ